jgi:hypothetical protein
MKLRSSLCLLSVVTFTLRADTTRTDAFSPAVMFKPRRAPGRRSFSDTMRLEEMARRDLLLSGGILWTSSQAHAAQIEPLADLPMIRLKLPKAALGREYVALRLRVKGQGPYDFMVDSGLTTELITPHLQQSLGIATGKNKLQGLASGGSTQSNDLVKLTDVSLCCGKFSGDKEIELPSLTAVITDFPQEHIDPGHDPVEGMLGMEVLSLFDVDFDFPAGRIRFWKSGTAAGAVGNKLVEIPAVVINETGLLGIRLSAPEANQPVLGFLDCGATFSAVNWSAAKLLGLPDKGASDYKTGPAIDAIGIDGRPFRLPTIKKELTFVGDVQQDSTTGRPIGFDKPPSSWKPWEKVDLAVGDLPVFPSLLGDGTRPYMGPAALIGLDVLSQRRVILEAGRPGTRKRRVFVSGSS